MNIFSRIALAEQDATRRLGNPLGDPLFRVGGRVRNERNGPVLARLAFMAALTGGRGFRVEPKGPKTDRDGRTRGERRAEIRRLYLERAPKCAEACDRRDLARRTARLMRKAVSA